MSACTLADLTFDEKAQIVDLPAALRSRARLLSFGLLPGAAVRILQNSGSHSLLIESRGLRFALGRSEARLIPVIRL
jgi:Fe2+ transport system protein FeoA